MNEIKNGGGEEEVGNEKFQIPSVRWRGEANILRVSPEKEYKKHSLLPGRRDIYDYNEGSRLLRGSP